MLLALRRGLGVAFIRAVFYPVERRKLDRDQINVPLKRDPNYGVDRVLMIFDRDENGTISPEAAFVNVAAFTGGFIGALIHGMKTAHYENSYFRETNEVTLFQSQRDAGRKLMDRTTIGFGRGAVRGGIRYGLFWFSFASISTVINRYRDKDGVIEYSIGGLMTGALFKFSLGPKGMISGGFFGAVLGTFFGVAILTAMKFSGCTMQDVYDTSHKYFRRKDAYLHGAERTQGETNVIYFFDSKQNNLEMLDDLKSESELKFNRKNIVKFKSSTESEPVNIQSNVKANK